MPTASAPPPLSTLAILGGAVAGVLEAYACGLAYALLTALLTGDSLPWRPRGAWPMLLVGVGLAGALGGVLRRMGASAPNALGARGLRLTGETFVLGAGFSAANIVAFGIGPWIGLLTLVSLVIGLLGTVLGRSREILFPVREPED